MICNRNVQSSVCAGSELCSTRAEGRGRGAKTLVMLLQLCLCFIAYGLVIIIIINTFFQCRYLAVYSCSVSD